MSKAWFPCYGGDLLSSMRWREMTPAQRGAYWQLIVWQMQSEDGTLPGDIDRLSRLADIELSANSIVLEAFPDIGGGKRANPRAFAEWQTRHNMTERKRSAAEMTNAKRSGERSAKRPAKRPAKRSGERDVLPSDSDTLSGTQSQSQSQSQTTGRTGSHVAGLPGCRVNYETTEVPEVWEDGYAFIALCRDPIVAAMAITGERGKRSWGAWVKRLNEAKRVMGSDLAERLFRGCLEQLWGEMKAGEVSKPGAVLNRKLKGVL